MRFAKQLLSPRVVRRTCWCAAVLVLALALTNAGISLNGYSAYMQALNAERNPVLSQIYNSAAASVNFITPTVSTLITAIFFSAILFVLGASADRLLAVSEQPRKTAPQPDAINGSAAGTELETTSKVVDDVLDESTFDDADFQIVPLPVPGKGKGKK